MVKRNKCFVINLSKIILIILTMFCTTVSIEQSFSIYRVLQQKISGKLPFVDHSIKLLKVENQTIMAEFQRNI